MASNPSSVGHRIAHRRQQLGMSRKVLAELVGRSAEWLRQIENGTRALDSIRLAVHIAQILGCERLDELMAISWQTNRPAGKSEVISSKLRLELAAPGTPDELDQSTAGVSTAELTRLQHIWWHAQYRVAEMDRGLTDLLPAARLRLSLQPSDEAAQAASVEVLGLARSYLMFVGERTLALVVAERAVAQTKASLHPARTAAIRGLALAYLQNKQFLTALSLAQAEANRLGSTLPILGGALLCVAAKAASHLRDRKAAAGLLKRARVIAETLGRDRSEHGVWFGAGELALTEMAVAWMIGAYDHVLAVTERTQAYSEMPAHFRIPFHALMATLYARRGDVGTAVSQLREIERLSPEAVVYNRMVHAALQSLAGTSHPLLGRDVRRMVAIAQL